MKQRNLYFIPCLVAFLGCLPSFASDYVIKDASSNPLLTFTASGDVVLHVGELVENATTQQLEGSTGGSFIVRTPSEVIARIDGSSGDFYLKGEANEVLSLTPSSVDPEFVIEDSVGTVVALITEDGDLKYVGDLVEP